MPRYLRFLSIFHLAISCVSPALSQASDAAPADPYLAQRALPIAIEADSAEQDEQSGLTVYRGNVTMMQGSLRIEANEIQFQSAQSDGNGKRKLNRVAASGDPAVFSHRETIEEEVVAQALEIDYLPADGKVVMQGDASLVQQASSVRGDRIEYFISEKKVRAAADPQTSSGRVKTVITPGQDFGINLNPGKAATETASENPEPAAR